jgi:myosin heavy subunit
MNKEKLIEMGLSEELATKVMGELDGNFVPKTRFNEVNEENKTLKTAAKEHEKQLETLKAAAGDNENLKEQIATLQQQNKDQQKAHETELKQLKFDNALESALVAAGAKSTKAVKAMLNVDNVKLNDDGKFSGLDEQLTALKTSDAYMFAEQQTNQTFKGFQPGATGNVKPGANVDTSKMTYSEMVAYLEANPNAKI